MLQSKARLLELNAKLAETLTSKGVTATAEETTTALVNKVADITSGDDSLLRGLIQRDLTEIVIPVGTTKIGDNAFKSCFNLKSITIPNSVTSIGIASLQQLNFSSITIPDSVKSIGAGAFYGCRYLKEVIILSKKINKLSDSIFELCNALKYVYLPDDFNSNGLNLSSSTLYSRETIVSWLNALADRTGRTAYKLTIGATNLAKLTEEDILIATNKNWTLA